MDKNYIIFIIGYDWYKELEKLELACDEAYELAEEIALRYKDFCLRNEWDEYYETLYTYCDEVISFRAVWDDVKRK